SWIYVKKVSGKWFNKRKNVAFLLILLLFLGPFLKIGGNQLFLFNILERKFLIFGVRFWPQDFHLLVISMLLSILFIV
ncbi:MAG: cytochrome c oxidase accessory protein CcoG, partial [Flavobacteriaceae bacterium]